MKLPNRAQFPSDVSDVKLEQAWRRLSATLQAPKHTLQRRSVLLAAALVCGTALGLGLFFGHTAHPKLVTQVAPSPSEPQPGLRLLDGAEVRAAANADLRVLEAQSQRVALELASGKAEFDVQHREGRQFVVLAGSITVRVIGTLFTVEHEGQQVRVSVKRGRVSVERPGMPNLSIAAQENWEGQAVSAALPAESSIVDAPAVAPRPRSGSPADALFEQAMQARRRGNTAQALEAFERMQREFPSDPRSSLASLEVARIRLDEMGDPAGALRSLDSSAADGAGSEDALARRVEGYDKLSELERCRAARAQYLKLYPHGAHRAVVQGRCTQR